MAKPARSCQNRIWPLGNHYAVNSRRDRLEQRRCSVPCQRLCGDSFVRGSIIDSPGYNCSPRSGWGWRLQQSSSWSRASLGQLEGPLGVMDGWMDAPFYGPSLGKDAAPSSWAPTSPSVCPGASVHLCSMTMGSQITLMVILKTVVFQNESGVL